MEYTEESHVLALAAPRALQIRNALHDKNPTFYPEEMLRSYKGAKGIYRFYGSGNSIANEVFNTPHGYWPEIRETMLGWFERFLKSKGDGSAIAETPFKTLSEDEVMVFKKGTRPEHITGIAEYCTKRATEIKVATEFDADQKKAGVDQNPLLEV